LTFSPKKRTITDTPRRRGLDVKGYPCSLDSRFCGNDRVRQQVYYIKKLDPELAARIEREENETKRLRKRVAQIEQENEILKKRWRTSRRKSGNLGIHKLEHTIFSLLTKEPLGDKIKENRKRVRTKLMTELVKRLDRLFLKLDHTALLVEQTLADATFAVESGKTEDIETIIQSDVTIDAREVETERECIRLLALYQPAAIDLRRICFVVKANSDMERIADYCVKMAKRGRKIKKENIAVKSFPAFYKLAEQVAATYRQTIRLFSVRGDMDAGGDSVFAYPGIEAARLIITADSETDILFSEFLEQTLAAEKMFHGRLKTWYELVSLGRSLERIGDLCTNIAKDAIFMFSGEIIRHESVEPTGPAVESAIIDG
jgi:phosphate transport system protein